jgi:hypothetical protein
MYLAAGGGLVDVKHRAVKPVNRVKNLSVILAVNYTEMKISSMRLNTITLENCVNNKSSE